MPTHSRGQASECPVRGIWGKGARAHSCSCGVLVGMSACSWIRTPAFPPWLDILTLQLMYWQNSFRKGHIYVVTPSSSSAPCSNQQLTQPVNTFNGAGQPCSECKRLAGPRLRLGRAGRLGGRYRVFSRGNRTAAKQRCAARAESAVPS